MIITKLQATQFLKTHPAFIYENKEFYHTVGLQFLSLLEELHMVANTDFTKEDVLGILYDNIYRKSVKDLFIYSDPVLYIHKALQMYHLMLISNMEESYDSQTISKI